MFTREGNHPAYVLSVPPSPHLLFCLKSGTHRSPTHVLSSGWWARPQKPHAIRSPDPTECPARGEWVGAPPSPYLPVQKACAVYPCACPPKRSAAHGLTTSSSSVPAATWPLGLAALLRDPLVTRYSEPTPSLAGVQMSHLRRGPLFLRPWTILCHLLTATYFSSQHLLLDIIYMLSFFFFWFPPPVCKVQEVLCLAHCIFPPCTPCLWHGVIIQYINAEWVSDFSEDLLCWRHWARPRGGYSQDEATSQQQGSRPQTRTQLR